MLSCFYSFETMSDPLHALLSGIRGSNIVFSEGQILCSHFRWATQLVQFATTTANFPYDFNVHALFGSHFWQQKAKESDNLFTLNTDRHPKICLFPKELVHAGEGDLAEVKDLTEQIEHLERVLAKDVAPEEDDVIDANGGESGWVRRLIGGAEKVKLNRGGYSYSWYFGHISRCLRSLTHSQVLFPFGCSFFLDGSKIVCFNNA